MVVPLNILLLTGKLNQFFVLVIDKEEIASFFSELTHSLKSFE